jgi:hypothetical protein
MAAILPAPAEPVETAQLNRVVAVHKTSNSDARAYNPASL